MSQKKLGDLVEKAYENRFSVWWRYALTKTRKIEDADEAVQDALFRTLRAAPEVESEEEANRYIWSVIRRTSVKTVGAESNRVRGRVIVEDKLRAPDQSMGWSPLDALIEAERRDFEKVTFERVMQEFIKLPEEVREAVEWHVLREPPMRLREIAKLQGVAISTVHNRVNRGLRQLARAIKPERSADR